MAGRLEATWLKRAHRGPMDAVIEATAMPGKGLAGDVNTSRRRQVTIITREVWEKLMRERWGVGVFAQVLDDGVITVGDAVVLEPATVSPERPATR